MEERSILKMRLSQKKKDRNGSLILEPGPTKPLTEKERKGNSLETLRKKREKKASSRSGTDIKRRKKIQGYSSDSDRSRITSDDEEEEVDVTLEKAISIQLTREKAEAWLYKPDFEKAIKGCFARVVLPNQPGSKEMFYRCVYIANVTEYHRKYKLNNTYTKCTINVSHGKAKREWMMDSVSNQRITDKEWERYTLVCKEEKIPLPSAYHIKKKVDEMKAVNDYVLTQVSLLLMKD